MDQYGSQLFDQLFKLGRKNVIDQVNEYQPAMDDNIIGQYDNRSIDEVMNERVKMKS